MKEYRIVCDVRTLWHDGHETYREGLQLRVIGVYTRYFPYKTKAEAQKALARTKPLVEDFDERTQREFPLDKSAIAYWHSNFRIQSRTVTEWAD